MFATEVDVFGGAVAAALAAGMVLGGCSRAQARPGQGTEIVPAGPFYRAEAFHQDYLRRNPGGTTCHYLRD